MEIPSVTIEMATRRPGLHRFGFNARTVAAPSRLLAVICCGAALLAAGGCGRRSALDVRPVSGTVKVDGALLEDGWITLRALSGDTRGFSGRIERGKYRLDAFAGRASVAITASRDVPGKMESGGPGTPDVPVREQFIPARYNDSTELEAEIPPDGISGLDFDLSTKD
jgi:hypothetical protein